MSNIIGDTDFVLEESVITDPKNLPSWLRKVKDQQVILDDSRSSVTYQLGQPVDKLG